MEDNAELGRRIARAYDAHRALGARVVERILAEVGAATVIATGGLASLIAPHTRSVQHVEPWLTLHGLRIVHERNHSGAST